MAIVAFHTRTVRDLSLIACPTDTAGVPDEVVRASRGKKEQGAVPNPRRREVRGRPELGICIEKREAGDLWAASFAILWAMQSSPHFTFTFSSPRNMNLRNPQMGIRAALRAGVPLADLSWPADSEVDALRKEAESAGVLVLLGCGVEPGLTEIMAQHLAEKLDRVDELHIQCGGIPETPAPPLGYKIVFGGRQLPLREADAPVVEGGQLTRVPRYSGVETTTYPGVGACEAWHEGFMPWLLDLEALKSLQTGTQKTVRWPGFAAKATFLRELGLLSLDPVEVEGVSVAPKKLLDAVLYPLVKLEEDERDITCFRVEVLGERKGRPCRYRVEMVDRYDEALGFTSMARTTAFTGAIVARMLARGDIQGQGLQTPEKFLTGALFDRLVRELAGAGVRFAVTKEKVKGLA